MLSFSACVKPVSKPLSTSPPALVTEAEAGTREEGGRASRISRVAGRHFLFGRPEKERFVDFLRRYELFTGVRAVTFCVMDNNRGGGREWGGRRTGEHLLLEVPKRPEVSLTEAAT